MMRARTDININWRAFIAAGTVVPPAMERPRSYGGLAVAMLAVGAALAWLGWWMR